MSFNNGPYIFSDVPGYEASKGERLVPSCNINMNMNNLGSTDIASEVVVSDTRDVEIADILVGMPAETGIVKAFRKLWAKINHLEQAKLLEKNTHSQEVQTSSDTDLTISDIKYEILKTQLRYLIKIVREYANEGSSNSVSKERDCLKTATDSDPTSSANNFRSTHESPDVQRKDHIVSPPGPTVSKMSTEISHGKERERNVNDHQVSTIATQTLSKVYTSDATEKLLRDHSKPHSHSHYHFNLDDVPFILGASSSASHSVVANVQNIIAKMKCHNRALCAPKPRAQRNANSAKVDRADTQDSNQMIQQLTEDLSKLTMRQAKLMKEAFDENASQHCKSPKVKTSQHFDTGGEQRQITSNAGGQIASTTVFQKNSKLPARKKLGGNFNYQEKHIVPTVRMQANEDPQLARRKMLRSLKDLNTHLSEEDLTWK